jgi:predicted nucleic acid-binding protein
VIVVDANVAAKRYLPEIGTDAALELLDGPSQLFAPDLIRLEVLGSITRCVQTGKADVDETRKRCDD